MSDDRVSPGSQAVVSRDIDVVQEQVITKAFDTLSNIRFSSIDSKKVYILSIPRIHIPTPLPQGFVTINQVPASDFPLLYDIKILKKGSEEDITLRPTILFMVKLKDEILNDLNEDQFAFIDDRLSGFRELMMAAKMFKRFSANLISKVTTSICNIGNAFEMVDLNQFKGRDFTSICDVMEADEKLAFMNMLRNKYVRIGSQMPRGYTPMDLPHNYIDTINDYDTYLVPMAFQELTMNELTRELFSYMYEHPCTAYDNMLVFKDRGLGVSQRLVRKALAANRNSRVPRYYYNKIAIENCYISPNTREEMRLKIDEMVSIPMVKLPLENKLREYTQSMRTSLSVSDVSNTFGLYIDMNKANITLTSIYKCLINPNLYIVPVALKHTTDIDNYFSYMSLLFFMSICPSVVVPEGDRIWINNCLLRLILLRQASDIQHIFNQVRIRRGIEIPNILAIDKWMRSSIDYMPLVYEAVSRQQQAEKNVLEILRMYFQNYPHTDISQDDNSLHRPWLMGFLPGEYARDVRYDDFRVKRNMHPNGALLINRTVRQYDDIDTLRYTTMIDIILKIYTNNQRGAAGGSVPTALNNFMNKLLYDGLCSFTVIMRAYNHYLMRFSTSVMCDGNVRQLDVATKRTLVVHYSSMLTMFLAIDPLTEFSEVLPAPLYEGLSTAFELRMFQRCYKYINRKVILSDNMGKILVKKQILQLAQLLCSLMMGVSEFDAKRTFGVELTDNATWESFLRQALEMDDNEIVIFNKYMQFVNSIKVVLNDLKCGLDEVDHFYLVQNAMRMSNPKYPEVLALSTVYTEDELEVVHVINDYEEYRKLMMDYENTNGMEFRQIFDKVWHSLEVPNRVKIFDKKDKRKIQAIRVNMRAKVSWNFIDSDSSFKYKSKGVGNTLEDDFEKNLNDVQGDIRKPKIFVIKQTCILNNLGENSTCARREINARRNYILKTLPNVNMIVPYDQCNPKVYGTTDAFLNYFTSSLSVRNNEFVIDDDFKPEFQITTIDAS